MIARRSSPEIDRRRVAPRRRGISLVENQIAFVVLGIGLAGLCPIVTMYFRQLANLEGNMHAPDEEHAVHYISPTTANGQRGRLQAFSYTYNSPGTARVQTAPGQVHYIIPWNNPWARKLTARARIVPGQLRASGTTDPSVAWPEKLHATLEKLERTTAEDGTFSGWRATVELKQLD